jgi:hypothetical protein
MNWLDDEKHKALVRARTSQFNRPWPKYAEWAPSMRWLRDASGKPWKLDEEAVQELKERRLREQAAQGEPKVDGR